ncbi:TPA: colicin immunity protein Cui [Serratia marcescens]
MKDDLFAWKKFAKIGILGIMPLVLIFVFFKTHPNSSIFHDVLSLTQHVKVNISSNNIPLSKSLGLYIIFGVFFALYFVIKYGSLIKLKENIITTSFILTKFIPFTVICFIYIYFMTFSDLDITKGNRLLKLVSSNNYLLLSYYLVSFIGVYCFSMLFLLVAIKIPAAIKNKSQP